jgi:hypothetical protein
MRLRDRIQTTLVLERHDRIAIFQQALNNVGEPARDYGVPVNIIAH